MILTRQEILLRMSSGDIYISPFNDKNLNPNSYNLSLGNQLLIYKHGYGVLDLKKDNLYDIIPIPDDGIVLSPNELYLAQTAEYTITRNVVPVLSGRSSIGRLGLTVHITAGFGDIGFSGHWTLEMSVVRHLKIYPNIPICQIYYHEVKGSIEGYQGKYQNNSGVQPSMIWKELHGST